MNELPILMNAEMVRATLDGRKTQTRRVIHPQPVSEGMQTFGESWKWSKGKDWFSGVTSAQMKADYGLLHCKRCPWKVGVQLWVRETFCNQAEDGYVSTDKFWYAATDPTPVLQDGDGFAIFNKDGSERSAWRPSIHMPRRASRINLEITGVRVDRLWDISGDDVVAEGVKCLPKEGTITWESDTRSRMAKMWNDIHGDGAWEKSNPWVWAITFKRVK